MYQQIMPIGQQGQAILNKNITCCYKRNDKLKMYIVALWVACEWYFNTIDHQKLHMIVCQQ